MAYYAAQSPRGFVNEIAVIRFATREDRDAWVVRHENDGDADSASQGAYAVTARQARKILRYRGDAVTASYNHMVERLSRSIRVF